MKVCKIFEWDAAHKLLLDYESKCQHLHGHTFRVEFLFDGIVNKNGMIIDFSLLKEQINKSCSFDHMCLNDLLEQPTAENLVDYLFIKIVENKELQTLLGNKIKLSRIRVWESSTSYAEDNYY